MQYKVIEKFVSINGEGPLAGMLSVFVRFAGCNLRCSYCDTIWANEAGVEYEELSEEDIYRYVKGTGIRNVTLTGGEPLLQEGIGELLQVLAGDSSIRVEVETNGSVDIGKFTGISPGRPAFTVDYKLGSSCMEGKMLVINFEYLSDIDTVKFVAGSIEDLQKAQYIIRNYNLLEKCNVHFSPVFGKLEMDRIVEFMKEHAMNGVRLQPQLHKIVWEAGARGV